MFHAGVVIVSDENGRLLILKRSDAVDHFAGYWNFPGGRPDDGEDPADCAARECFEESGIKIDPNDLYFIDSIKRSDEKHIYFFAYENCNQPVVIDWESSDYKWIFASELSSTKMIPMPKEFIEMLSIHFNNNLKNENKT
tara:strand:- start:3363 stop:3782 length:420 start_codon:yes stop_codon:yes gene_type:complete